MLSLQVGTGEEPEVGAATLGQGGPLGSGISEWRLNAGGERVTRAWWGAGKADTPQPSPWMAGPARAGAPLGCHILVLSL